MKRNVLLLLAVFGAVSARAFTFDDVRVWVGSGPNRAMIVMDFNDGSSPSSFAWGFRWSGAATGDDAISALSATDPTLQLAILGQTGVGFGRYIDSAQYDSDQDGAFDHVGAPWPAGYWSYFNKPAGGAWDYAQEGMSTRALSDGDWDGWSYVPASQANATPPAQPVAAVPEPATLVALAIGAATLATRRRGHR